MALNKLKIPKIVKTQEEINQIKLNYDNECNRWKVNDIVLTDTQFDKDTWDYFMCWRSQKDPDKSLKFYLVKNWQMIATIHGSMNYESAIWVPKMLNGDLWYMVTKNNLSVLMKDWIAMTAVMDYFTDYDINSKWKYCYTAVSTKIKNKTWVFIWKRRIYEENFYLNDNDRYTSSTIKNLKMDEKWNCYFTEQAQWLNLLKNWKIVFTSSCKEITNMNVMTKEELKWAFNQYQISFNVKYAWEEVRKCYLTEYDTVIQSEDITKPEFFFKNKNTLEWTKGKFIDDKYIESNGIKLLRSVVKV